MNSEKIQNVATVITATLEEEGMMPVVELKDYTNFEDQDIELALDFLSQEKRVQLFPNGKVVNVMLVF